MSDCPHLTSACDAAELSDRAKCPGVRLADFIVLATRYPVEADQNPLTPMLALEDPLKYGGLVAEVQYLAARERFKYSLYALDGSRLRLLALEAVERVWWVRKNSKDQTARELIAALKACLAEPLSMQAIHALGLARLRGLNYLRCTPADSPSGMVIRALYRVSGSNALDYREALGLCSDAVAKAHQKQHGFIGAKKLAIAEVEWQRARWAEMGAK